MKTVIEMAREAGGGLSCIAEPLEHPWKFSQDELERFAALVRADERDANAKTCSDLYKKWVDELNNDTDEEDDPAPPDWLDCKLAIESRGNT